MSFPIFLTSPAGQSTSDFKIDFIKPIPLYGRQYEVSLVQLNAWNSIQNIKASYGNNTFSYSHAVITGGVLIPVVIPDGLYTVDQLSAEIAQVLTTNSHLGGGGEIGIVFYPNFSTGKVEIQLPAIGGVSFVFRFTSLFQELFGFTSPTYPVPSNIIVSTYGNETANMTRGVSSWTVNCSLIQGTNSYLNSNTSDVLYSFNILTPPSSVFQIEPQNKYYVALSRSDFIDSIRMTIRDQTGRIQDFNGETISYLLHLRPSTEYGIKIEE